MLADCAWCGSAVGAGAALISPTRLPLRRRPSTVYPSIRDLHSFRFELNLSSYVHRMTQLTS